MNHRILLPWLAAMLVLLAGCLPEAKDTLGGEPTISGIWEGTITEDTPPQTFGSITVTVVQQGLVVSGTFNSYFPASDFTNSGTINGYLNAPRDAGNFDLISSDPDYCPLFATGAFTGLIVSGTYATQSDGVCTVTAARGTFVMQKE